MHLVDNIYLVAAAGRRELHSADNLLADVLHTGARGSVQLVDVGVQAVGNLTAGLAAAVRMAGRCLLAEQRLGQ